MFFDVGMDLGYLQVRPAEHPFFENCMIFSIMNNLGCPWLLLVVRVDYMWLLAPLVGVFVNYSLRLPRQDKFSHK